MSWISSTNFSNKLIFFYKKINVILKQFIIYIYILDACYINVKNTQKKENINAKKQQPIFKRFMKLKLQIN